MIWLFNGSSVLFVILFVVGFVLLNAFASTTVLNGRQVFPLFGLKAPNDFVSFMLFILWLALTILISYWYAIRKYKKLNNLLLEKCDPPQYINALDKLLRKRVPAALRTGLLLNLSTGFLSLRDAENAGRILCSITCFPNTRVNAANKVVYYSNFFTMSLYGGNVQNAALSLDYMKYALADGRIKGKDRQKSAITFQQDFLVFNVRNGNLEGAEQNFIEWFRNADTMFSKVNAQFSLGEVYLHSNKPDEARAAFAYAAEHGNKLYIAQKAREYLGIPANA